MFVVLIASLLPVPAPPPVPDPFPIRRIATTEAALPTPPGGLRKLPTAEFEALVQAAGRAAVTPAPRVVAARYAAKFSDEGLVGTGTWSVVAPRPGVVALDPFRQAVTDAAWPGGRPAVLYRGPAGGLNLLADPDGGAGDVAFGWSARGLEEPGETRFELRFPATAAAVLTLDLPAGRVPAVAQPDVLLTGPTPSNGRAVWTVAFGGLSRVDLAVRTPNRAGDLPPLARGPRSARFDLAPGQAAAAFEFDLESVRGPADVWTFAVDPGLTVLDVVAVGKAAWHQTGGTVSLLLKEPVGAVRVAVTAVAPFPTGAEPWAVPLVRPAGLSGDETLDVRCGPDLVLHGWDAGDFRVATVAATADRGTAVTFRGTVTAAGGARRVPTVRTAPAAPAVTSVEAVTWRIGPDESRLTANFKLTAVRGPVLRIPIRFPDGYAPDPPRLVPADPAAGWDPAGPHWVLTPSKPLAAGQTLDVTVVARGPGGPGVPDPGLRAPEPRRIPYPSFGPAVADRSGSLVLDCGPEYRAFPPPGTALAYAGAEPTGFWALRPLRPGVTVSVETAPADRGGVEYTLHTDGASGPLTLVTPPGAGVPRAGDGTATVSGLSVGPWLLGSCGPFLPTATAGTIWTVVPDRGSEVRVAVPCPAGAARPRFLGTVEGDGPPEVAAAEPLARRFLVMPMKSEPPLPREAGWAAAVVLAAVGLGWAATRRAGFAVWLGVVGLAAVFAAAVVGGPAAWRPVLVVPAAVAGLAAAVGAVVRRAAAVTVMAVTTAAVAQAPEPATVYTVGPSTYAPPAVLAKLRAPVDVPVPPVVLTAAAYTGTAVGDAAEFDAEFVAVTAAGEHTVLLPLTGVRLTRATVDAAAAFPDAAADGLSVTVRGAGRHTLRLRFTAPIQSVGADREIAFPIPDVPDGRVRFTAPPAARAFAVPKRRGKLTAARGTVAADLGGGKLLTLRWRTGGPVGGAATVSASSTCIWDLDDADPGVTAAFFVRPDRGTADRFRVAVPPGLEPGRVSVRTPDAGPNGVRDWTFDPPGPDGWRVLHVRVQGPVEGKAVLALRCAPTVPLAAKPRLLFPKLLGAAATDAAFAVRTAGPVAAAWEKTGLIDFPAEAALKDAPAVPELQLDRRPAARAFRRDGEVEPVLMPTLVPPPDPAPTAQTATFGIGPRLTVTGTAAFLPGTAHAAFAPPPGVTVTAVRGPALVGWAVADGRVRAWFRPGPTPPTLTWAGTVPAGDPATPTLPAGSEVIALDGWVLHPGEKPHAAPPPGDRDVRIAEAIGPAPGGLKYTATVTVAPRVNRPLPFGVRLSGSAGGTLAVPPTFRVAETDGGWDVVAPADAPVTVTVSALLPASAGTPLPDCEVLLAGHPAAAVRSTDVSGSGFGVTAAGDDPRILAALPPTVATLPPPVERPAADPIPPADDSAPAALAHFAAFLAAALLASHRRLAPEGLAAVGGLMLAVSPVAAVPLLAVGLSWRAARLGRRVRKALFR